MITFFLVNAMLIYSSELEYSLFMKSFSAMSLALLPLNMLINNLLADLPHNDNRYVHSFRKFIMALVAFSFILLCIGSLVYDSFFIPGFVAVLIIFINATVNVIDKERRYTLKLIATLLGLISCWISYLVLEDITYSYLFFFLAKALLYLGIVMPFIFVESTVSPDKGNQYHNLMLSIASGFGDNGLRYFATELLSPLAFGNFDIILRIFYSGRNLAGRLHYPALLDLQRTRTPASRLKFNRINVLISVGFMAGLLVMKGLYDQIERINLNWLLIWSLTTTLFINLTISYFYNELLKLKSFLMLSLGTISLPVSAMILMYSNFEVELVVQLSVLVQSIGIYYLYQRKGL